MLTYAVRDGIICHCGEVNQTVLRPRDEDIDLSVMTKPNEYAPYTWEGCVVKVADKIAYLGRDIEDAVRLHILTEEGEALQALKKELNSRLHANLQSVTNTAIMYPLITNICKESSPERGIVFSPDHLELMRSVMEFNYRHIYHNKRLAVYHEYARLILTSIYKILKGCYDGDETLDNVYLLEKDYPMLGTHFLERLKIFRHR